MFCLFFNRGYKICVYNFIYTCIYKLYIHTHHKYDINNITEKGTGKEKLRKSSILIKDKDIQS